MDFGPKKRIFEKQIKLSNVVKIADILVLLKIQRSVHDSIGRKLADPEIISPHYV